MEATNIKEGKRVAVMHGELCLQPVEKIPDGETKQLNSYIAAHSETNHHHVVESTTGFELVEKDGERYLLIKDVAKLFHQKTFDVHETQWLAPGAYKLTEKTEYSPIEKLIRRVYD